MIAYKLLRVRKDGTIGPLFVNRRQRIEVGTWLEAEVHYPKGLAFRPGWHATIKPHAPHLTEKGRRWYKVKVKEYKKYQKPQHQGGTWVLSKWLKVIEPVNI